MKIKKKFQKSRLHQNLDFEFWSQHSVLRLNIHSSYSLWDHDLASKDVSANENKIKYFEITAKSKFGKWIPKPILGYKTENILILYNYRSCFNIERCLSSKKQYNCRIQGQIRIWKLSFEFGIMLKYWKPIHPMHSKAMLRYLRLYKLMKDKIKFQNSRPIQSSKIKFWSQHHVIRWEVYPSDALKGHALAPKVVSDNDK
jgi:hypothetical protein